MIQTPLKRVLFGHTLSTMLLGVFSAFMVFVSLASVVTLNPTPAKAATSKTLNYQARLLNNSGSIVTDGSYNVEFKLYDAVSGGTLLWTETRYDSNGVTAGNDNRVQVKAGYLSVYLGDINDLPSNIWDKQLWLTMNIGGTTQTASPTWDGEMNPRLRLTAVPAAYSLTNYNSVTGFSSSLTLASATGGDQSFVIPDQGAAGTYTLLTTNAGIQNQNASDQTANFRISGTGRANTALQAPLFDTATAAALAIGTTNATAINLNQNTTIASTKSLTVTAGATSLTGLAAGTSTALNVVTGATTNKGIVVQGVASQSANAFEVQDNTGNVNLAINGVGNQLTLGRVAASGTVTQGLLQFADGTTSNFSASIEAATLTADRRFILPDTALATTASPGTICVYNGAASNCPAATGSAFYIQNATTVQTAANFYIRSAATGSVGAVIEGANGQTANLLNLNTYNGTTSTTVASFSNTGALTAVGVDSGTGLIQGTGGTTLTGTAQINATGSAATTIGNASAGTLTLQGDASTTIVANSGANKTTLSFATPTGTRSIVFPDASGTVTLNPTSGSYIRQVPASTAENTVTPTANGVVGLTVNGTSGTAATALAVSQPGAAAGITVTSTNNTATDALAFSGTFTNLINSTNFNVTNAGAVTAVGVNSGAGLLQGAAGLTVSGAATSINNNSNFNTSINTGSSTGAVAIGNANATGVTVNASGAQDAVRITGASTTVDNVDGLDVRLTQGDSPSNESNSGISVSLTSNSTNSGDTLRGIFINNITGGAATERAIQIGTGFDQGLYFADTNATIAVANTGTFNFKDSVGNSLFAIKDNGTSGIIGTVDLASGNTDNVTLQSGNATSGNSGNVSIDVGTASGSKGNVNIGTTNTNAVNIGNSTAATNISIQGGTGNNAVSIQASGTGSVNVGTAASAQVINIGSSSAGNLTLQTGSTLRLNGATQTLVQQTTSTNNAFEVKDQSGNAVFGVDASNRKVTIGAYTAGQGIGQLMVQPTTNARVGISIVPASGSTVDAFQVYTAGFTPAGASSSDNVTFRISETGIAGSPGSSTASTRSSTFKSGDTSFAGGTTGAVILQSGANTGSGNTGALTIQSGNATSGNSGAINIDTGTATGTVGAVNINSASNGIVTIGNGTSTAGAVQIQGGASSYFGVTNATGTTRLTFQAPSTAGTVNFRLPAGGTGGNTYDVCTTLTVCSGYAATPASGAYLQQVPTSTATNTVTPTANSVVGLTVNGTTGTAATALAVSQPGAAAGITIASANNTATNGLSFSGTFTNLISSTNFSVTNAGAITGVGVNSGTGLLQGTGGVTLTGTAQINATGTSTTAIGNNSNTANTVNISAGSTGGINLQANTTVATGANFTVAGGTASVTGPAAGSATALTVTTNAATNKGLSIVTTGSSANAFEIFSGATSSVTAAFSNGGDLTLGSAGAAAAGSLSFADGTSNGFLGTMVSTTLTNNRSYTLQDNSGVVALGTAGNSLFFTTTGATNVTLPTSGTLVAAPASGSFLQQVPTSTATNTVTPTANSVVGLTVNGTTGTAATALAVSQPGAAAGITIASANNTATNGLSFSGTFTNLISSTNFSVTNAGALTAASAITVGSGAGVGQLTNNGATLNTTLALGNFAGGGSIGTAATTVDIYTSISVAQTTASQTLTLSAPTANTAYGRMLYLSNVGSTSFTFGTTTINPGTTATLIWSNTNGGASWQFAGADGNGILNQNSTDQSANFRISGTGRANTSFQTPLLDVATAGTLSLGTATATAVSIGKLTVTTTSVGNFSIGASAGSGTVLTNNGATVNSTLALGDFATGGSIGTAATTVDIYSAFSVAQTTASQTLTLPTPTANTTYGRMIYVTNIGTTSFTLLGTTVNQGTSATLIWSNTNGGASWQFAGADGNGILNQNATDQTANFRISGTGRANTSFTSPLFDSISGGVGLGTSTATGVTIGGTTNTTAVLVQGAAAATYTVGTANNTGGITIGNSTASNTIAIGNANTATGNTQTINIGAGTPAGTGQTTITVGNTTSTSTLNLRAGTGDVNIRSADLIDLETSGGTSVVTFNTSTTAADVALFAGAGGAIGTSQNAVRISTSFVPTTDGAFNYYGLNASPTLANTATNLDTVTFAAINGSATYNGTGGRLGTAIGGRFGVSNTSARTLTNAYGVQIQNAVNSGGGTLTSAAGLAIANQTAGGTNNVNLLVGTTTIPTGSFNLYVTGGTGTQVAATINNGTSTGNILSAQDNGTNVLVVADGGNVGIKTGATAPSADLTFGDTANRTINVLTRTTNAAGNNLTIAAGAAGAGATAFAGGSLTLQGGAAAGTTGNTNGGDVTISGGTGQGATGYQGLVNLSSTAFATAPIQTIASTGVQNITAGNQNIYSTLPLTASVSGVIAVLGDPGQSVIGRILYVAARSGSQDFTLRLNSARTPIDIVLKANSTATLIWNGTDWTAAGASSSTDLQAAYNNTASSAGAAELVLKNTATSNGLTVRNGTGSDEISGGLFEVQTAIGSNLFSVNNNAVEFANNGGAESSTFTMWTAAPAGGTASRYTTAGDNIATGTASAFADTTATANTGIKNTLSSSLTANLKYKVSYTVRHTSSTIAFNTLDTIYSVDGTATTATCASGSTVTNGTWTRIDCSFTATSVGASNAIIIRHSDAVEHDFYIDNLSVTVSADVNHAVDGSVDLALGSNWTAFGTLDALTRETTIIYDTSGSVNVDTPAATDRGVRNNMAINPAINTQYLVSFYARSSNAFNDIRVRYSRDGGTNFVSCVDYNTQVVSTTTFTKITCVFTTDGTPASNADLIIDQPTSSNRNFYIDALSVTLNTNNSSNVQVGGGQKGGPTTLFTLDRSSGAPIAANNDAYLGSMYYDTASGRIQCYEADGWGACGAAPDNIVNLNPEYAGAVLNGSGVGTMTADFCSNDTALTVNGALCSTGQAKNFYKWTSPQATDQTYSVYVTYQLPATFNGFSSDDTVQLVGRVDNTSNASITYEMYKSTGSAVTQCGTGGTNVITGGGGSANTWYSYGVNGNEATGCSFSSASAGNFIIFKINLTAKSGASAYVSTLSFTTTGR